MARVSRHHNFQQNSYCIQSRTYIYKAERASVEPTTPLEALSMKGRAHDPNWDAFAHAAHASQLGSCNYNVSGLVVWHTVPLKECVRRLSCLASVAWWSGEGELL